jgi:hypothetical protein
MFSIVLIIAFGFAFNSLQSNTIAGAMVGAFGLDMGTLSPAGKLPTFDASQYPEIRSKLEPGAGTDAVLKREIPGLARLLVIGDFPLCRLRFGDRT